MSTRTKRNIFYIANVVLIALIVYILFPMKSNYIFNAPADLKYAYVTFNSNGGTMFDSQVVDLGNVVNYPGEPTREGYIFTGWEVNGEEYNFNTEIKEDVEIEATWSKVINTYEATFIVDDQIYHREYFEEGNTVTKPKNPTKKGYKFEGWYNDGYLYSFRSGIKSDLVLHAKWSKPVSVKFIYKNGNASSESSYRTGEKVIKPTNPYREGYTFLYWVVKGETEEYDFSREIEDNLTLVAKYEKNYEKVTITFDSDGGSNVPSREIVKGKKALAPYNPLKKGCVFAGWYYKGNLFSFNTKIKKDIKLTAHWKEESENIKTYIVTFDEDNFKEPTKVKIIEGGVVEKPNNPKKDNYKFIGWYLNNKKYDFNNKVYSDIYLIAHYTKKGESYVVSFNSNGGSNIKDQIVSKGKKITIPNRPIRNGYKFLGWYLDGNRYNFNKTVKSDMTLEAKWQEESKITYTVLFDSNGGSAVKSVAVINGNTISRPTNPTRNGYNFAGWYNGKTLFNFSTRITSNIILKAKWTKNSTNIKYYTVTFDSDGGTKIDNQTIKENGNAYKPVNPIKEGYKFLHWELNKNKYDFKTKVTSNIILKAIYTKIDENNIKKYIVSFDSDGGTKVNSQTINEGTRAIEPSIPTKEGYKFEGWYLKGNKFSFTTIISSDITLTAKWIKNDDNNIDQNTEYTITFNSNGGSEVKSQIVKFGGLISKPSDPTRSGYTFVEWLYDNKSFDFNTKVTSNVTLVAKWNENNETSSNI